jgi:hypothetical protein
MAITGVRVKHAKDAVVLSTLPEGSGPHQGRAFATGPRFG